MKRRLLPWVILLAGAFVYPVVVLGGGTPRFTDRGECVRPADAGGDLDAVFGRFRNQASATAKLRRVLEVGFKGSQIEHDGCGFLKVVVHGIPNLAVGREFLAEARAVEIHATLERAAP
jgi:hypothetical protein